MRTIDIIQGSPEWHELRKRSIGSSDAPVVMGLSKWKTRRQLWGEKLGLTPDSHDNRAMKHGRDTEDTARKAYEIRTGVIVCPHVVVHPTFDWMVASMDGLSVDESSAVEIKSPYGDATHDLARGGKIPDEYYCQIQQQIACSGLDSIDYFSFKDGEGILIKVERDEKYISNLTKELIEFKRLIDDLEEPELSAKDYVERSDGEWLSASAEWKSIREKIADLEAVLEPLLIEEKRIRRVIEDLCGEQSSIGAGVKCTRFFSKSPVDYKSIEILRGIDLEKYRKPPVWKYRLSTPRSDENLS